jgi:hypothetical protein
MVVEIMKTGTYKIEENIPLVVDQTKLDQMVKGYDPRKFEVPVSIGPIKADSPAWAWVKALRRAGNVLFAELRDCVPEFADMLRAGAFTKRAVSLTPFGTLKTISFLGAEPPAVPALDGFKFSQGPHITYEFTESDLEPSDKIEILINHKINDDPNLSYSQAFSEVQKDNPELTWAYIEELSHHNKKGGRK